MFGQFSEHMKKSSQPMSELFAANMKAMETVTQQQTHFLSGLLNDSVKLVQTMSEQTEANGMIAVQSVFAESVRERLTSASKGTYNALSSVSKQYSDAFSTGFEAASETAKEGIKTAVSTPASVAKAASAKPASTKKAAVKKAPVKKTVAKATKNVASVTTNTDKAATAKKAVAKKPANKASVKAKPVTKAATKPVATLSAEQVKAPIDAKSADAKSTAKPVNNA